MNSVACAVNIMRPLGTMSRKLAAVQGSTCRASRLTGILPRDAEQPQVEHRDRAEEQPDADDVDGLDRGIEPQPLAHRLPEAGGLEAPSADLRRRVSPQLYGFAAGRDALGAQLLGLVAVRIAFDASRWRPA